MEALFEVAGLFGHAEGEEGGRSGGLGEDLEDGFAVGSAFFGGGVFEGGGVGGEFALLAELGGGEMDGGVEPVEGAGD